MTSSPFIYCCVCGAANHTQATQCFACSQPVEACIQDTALPPFLAELPVSPALLARGYRLLALVGKGGFGAVYQAQDVQHPGRLVALKQINLRGLSPQQVIEATDTFNREVGLLSGLAHPNLPRIYEHFADPEHWYLAMDFITGETLEDYLSRATGGHLAVEEVLDIGIQLCSVLDYLHVQQPPIIFRDVKPANVMRTASGHLYLIDFGIARHFRPGQRKDTAVLGSPGYAPPEQYGRAQTTVRSDIYSLGATLHSLLTGTDPSEAISGEASPAGQDQEVPAELEQLLVQMRERDASRRPPSMQAVKRTLWRIQAKQRSLPPRVLLARQPLQRPGYAIQHMPFTVVAGGQILPSLAKRGVSRRTAIISLVGLVGFATIGGGVTLSALLTHSFQDPHLLYTLPQGALSLAWSPDGTRIAAAGAERDRTIRIWTASDGRPLLIYRGHPLASNIAWSPDSTRLASVGLDQAVQVWNASNGKLIWTYRDPTEHDLAFRAMAWSPDGKHIATIGVGQDIQIWNAADGRLISTYRGLSFACSLAWSPDGTRIASGGWDRSVQVWRVDTGKPIWTYQLNNPGNDDINTVNAIAWSPDGTRIASGGSCPLILFASNGGVQVWDASTGKQLLTYWGHDGSSDIEVVAWSPNGKSIASGGTDNTVQLWEPTTGNQVLSYRHPNEVLTIAWSPDSTRIAAGGSRLIEGSPPNTIQVLKLP